jgi:hypothetical protein
MRKLFRRINIVVILLAGFICFSAETTLVEIKTKLSESDSLELSNNRLIIMGFTAGGHLAGRTVGLLNENEQPDGLIMISSAYFDEIIRGTVFKAVFPREESPGAPRRILINEINQKLAVLAKEQSITMVDISSGMLKSDGSFISGMTSDYCHPTEKGYQVWAEALRPLLFETK